MSRTTHHTCSSSMRASLRYDILRAGGCARSSVAVAYNAPGMDTGHQFHSLGPTQVEPGEKFLQMELPYTVSCALATGRTNLVHLILRVLWLRVSLSSYRRSSISLSKRFRYQRNPEHLCTKYAGPPLIQNMTWKLDTNSHLCFMFHGNVNVLVVFGTESLIRVAAHNHFTLKSYTMT